MAGGRHEQAADLPTMAYVAPTGIHVTATDRSHTVRGGDTVYDIAARYGVSPRALVSANSLPQDGRWIMAGTVLRIPAGPGSGTVAAPSPSSGATSPTSASGAGGTVTVRAGDTLSHLAARHGVSVGAIVSVNDLSDGRLIYPGQVIRVPGSGSSASRSQARTEPAPLSRPYDESTIGDRHEGEQVEATFLHYRYSSGTARSAAANREHLASVDVPGQDAMKTMIADTARRHGVDPDLMVTLSYQESGWNHRAVSPANAIGAMQVVPTSGQ